MKKNLHKYSPPWLGSLVFLLAVLSLSPALETQAAVLSHKVVNDVSGLTAEQLTEGDADYVRLRWEGMRTYGTAPGAPELPVRYVRLYVPLYTKDFKVEVRDLSVGRQIELPADVYPVQEDWIADGRERPAFVSPDPEAYRAVAEAPLAEVTDESFIDGCNHVVTVRVSPLSYDAASGNIILYSSVGIELSYTPCGEEDMAVKPVFPGKPSRFIHLDKLVDNPEDLPAKSSAQRKSASTDPNNLDSYVIITSRKFVDAFAKLAAWKRQKGYQVIIAAIEDILSDPQYSAGDIVSDPPINDDAGKLRMFLKELYDNPSLYGACFVLLGGDYYTNFPIRYAYNTTYAKSNDKAHPGGLTEENHIPTDWYFSNISTNWNNDKEEYLENFPDKGYDFHHYVGRLLCHNEEDIENFTNKLILYESNPGNCDNEYLNRAFIIAHDDLEGPNTETKTLLNEIYDSKANRFFQSHLSNEPENPNRIIYTGNQVINELSNHYGYISLQGHGNPGGMTIAKISGNGITALDSYMQKECFMDKQISGGTNGIDKIDYSNSPGIVYTLSCSLTPFDLYNEPGVEYDETTNGFKEARHLFDIPSNFGRSFVCGKGYGGPVFLGNTRAGWTSLSSELEQEFLRQVQNHPKIGIAEALSKNVYQSKYLVKVHNVIGDPECELWLGVPKRFSLSNTISRNGNCVLADQNLNNSSVVVYDGVSPFTYSIDDHTYRLELPGLDPGTLVSVWKTGFLPYIQLYLVKGVINSNKAFSLNDAIRVGYPIYEPLTITNNARLKLTSNNSVAICNNVVVESGSILEVQSKEIVIESGATINEGGTLKLNIDNFSLLPGDTDEFAGTFEVGANKIIIKPDVSVSKGSYDFSAKEIVIEPGVTFAKGAKINFKTN